VQAAALADQLGTPLGLLAGPLRRALDVPAGQPLGAGERAGLQAGREVVDDLVRTVEALRRGPPAAAPSPPVPVAELVPIPVGTTPAGDGRPVVLVADGGPAVLALLAQLLAAAGWRVHTAAGGREALERCRELAPDLLLASATLPGMDGRELVRAVRTDPATAGLPVVLTGGSGPGALAAGADDHLARPFDPDEVLARLRTRLAAARARTAELAEHGRAERHLRIALAARERVGTAVGLVMAQRRCTAEEAFTLLREASQRGNVKLAEVARRVVETAELHGRGV
jgi:CheY-like chemotaxis protein